QVVEDDVGVFAVLAERYGARLGQREELSLVAAVNHAQALCQPLRRCRLLRSRRRSWCRGCAGADFEAKAGAGGLDRFARRHRARRALGAAIVVANGDLFAEYLQLARDANDAEALEHAHGVGTAAAERDGVALGQKEEL